MLGLPKPNWAATFAVRKEKSPMFTETEFAELTVSLWRAHKRYEEAKGAHALASKIYHAADKARAEAYTEVEELLNKLQPRGTNA
jgi:hypothetical protein